MYQTTIGIPRHAAGPRQVARAAELWRIFQEVAVQASTSVGWPPQRYVDAGTAFVVYGMTATHHRQVAYGQHLQARSWVHDFRRATLTTRQIRLSDAAGPVSACTQRWVHVDALLRPCRASQELLDSLPVEEPVEEPAEEPVEEPAEEPAAPSVVLPPLEDAVEGAVHSFEFSPWFTAMDPLGHLNHPAYVDACDEGTSRALVAAGVDPHLLVPIAEQITFKRGVVGGERVVVQTRVVGSSRQGHTVLDHLLHRGAELVATGRTVRVLANGADLCSLMR